MRHNKTQQSLIVGLSDGKLENPFNYSDSWHLCDCFLPIFRDFRPLKLEISRWKRPLDNPSSFELSLKSNFKIFVLISPQYIFLFYNLQF